MTSRTSSKKMTNTEHVENFLSKITFSNIEIFNLAESYFENCSDLKLIILDSIKSNFKDTEYTLLDIYDIYDNYILYEIHAFSILPSLVLITPQRELIHNDLVPKEELIDRESLVAALKDDIIKLGIDVYYYPELEDENNELVLVDNFHITLIAFAQDIASYIAKVITEEKDKVRLTLDECKGLFESEYFKSLQKIYLDGSSFPNTCLTMIRPEYETSVIPNTSIFFKLLEQKLCFIKAHKLSLTKKIAEQFLNSIAIEYSSDEQLSNQELNEFTNFINLVKENGQWDAIINTIAGINDLSDDDKEELYKIANPIAAYCRCKSPCDVCNEFRSIVNYGFSNSYLYKPRDISKDIKICMKTRKNNISFLHKFFTLNFNESASPFTLFIFNSLAHLYNLPDSFVTSTSVLRVFNNIMTGRILKKFWPSIEKDAFITLIQKHVKYILSKNLINAFILSHDASSNAINWDATNKMLTEIPLPDDFQQEILVKEKYNISDPTIYGEDINDKLDNLTSIEELEDIDTVTDYNIGNIKCPNLLTGLLISTYIFLLFLIITDEDVKNKTGTYKYNINKILTKCIMPGGLKFHSMSSNKN